MRATPDRTDPGTPPPRPASPPPPRPPPGRRRDGTPADPSQRAPWPARRSRGRAAPPPSLVGSAGARRGGTGGVGQVAAQALRQGGTEERLDGGIEPRDGGAEPRAGDRAGGICVGGQELLGRVGR